MSDYSTLEYLKLAIYYASYLYIPSASLLMWAGLKSKGYRQATIFVVLAVLTVFAYARFVEPRILVVSNHDIMLDRCGAPARIAVFSDTHQGLFGHSMSIERIAKRVQLLNSDAVLIPGDFVYFLATDRFENTFQALSKIDAPIFAVLGNHDNGMPGPDIGQNLTPALEAIGVHVLNDDVGSFRVSDTEFQIVGLSDAWAEKQKRELLYGASAIPRLVLTHNPRTILELSGRAKLDLMVAGHTHGGQINIPGVTCWLLPFACHVVRYGLEQTPRGKVFVTSGTGMVGLPMRFNVPPKIDLLTIKLERCS